MSGPLIAIPEDNDSQDLDINKEATEMHFLQPFRPNNTLNSGHISVNQSELDDSSNLFNNKSVNNTARKSYNALFYSNVKLTF